MSQRSHLRFIGGKIYCPQKKRRYDLGWDHQYGQEFICPGCMLRIDALRNFTPRRRS